ncbi:MAG: hypothetical protein RTU30_08910 [Candidatus Thorarchaeota archaeon]
MSGKNPAMVNAVENPSGIIHSGECDEFIQRKETGSHQRNDVPVKRGKAHNSVDDSGHLHAGDSSIGKGGTQKFLAVHSKCEKWIFRAAGYRRW